jgi:hypothetical protein
MSETDKTVTFTPAETLALWVLLDAAPTKGQADQRQLTKAWDALHLDDVKPTPDGRAVLLVDGYEPKPVTVTEEILTRVKKANEDVMTPGGKARVIIGLLDKMEAALK